MQESIRPIYALIRCEMCFEVRIMLALPFHKPRRRLRLPAEDFDMPDEDNDAGQFREKLIRRKQERAADAAC
jgi:hypothetical protein